MTMVNNLEKLGNMRVKSVNKKDLLANTPAT